GAGVAVLGRGADVRPDGAAARGVAPGAAVGRRRAPDEAGVAAPVAPAAGRGRNLRLRIRPPVGAPCARSKRSLACGAPRNALAQAGTRREYVHVASSSTSMSPTVPSWARPFHDAEPSAWVDASAARAVTPRASRERWCALAKSRRRPGRKPGRGTFAKADRLSSVSAPGHRGCRRVTGDQRLA